MSNRHGKLSEDSARLASIIDKETRDALIELARRERRSLSNYVAAELAKIVAAKQPTKAKGRTDSLRRIGGGDTVRRPA